MPVGYPPSIFISSTCYDLSQVRLDLKRFIESLGYEAIISEHPAFPVNPQVGTVENVVNAVKDRADLFVLIVGGRYGSQAASGRSITNLEYLEARAKAIPIYVFVAKRILHTLPVWKANPTADFPGTVDDTKLFQFVDELRGAAGHWVYEFDEVADIIATLRHQWAVLFSDAMTIREQVRGARLSPDLMTLPPRALRILLEKPKTWEYQLYSAVLKSELDALAGLRRDLKYGLRIGPVNELAATEVFPWIRIQFERLIRLVNSLSALGNEALQEAFGPPGQPGNPELIVYVARRMADVAQQVIAWTTDFLSVRVDPEFERLIELTSKFSTDVLDKLESFPPWIDEEMQKVEHSAAKGEKYKTELILRLSTPVPEGYDEEMERLKSHFGIKDE